MKNAKYPNNLDILLDSIHNSYRDSKSKKSSQEIKFQLRYGHFSRFVVFFGTPCTLRISTQNIRLLLKNSEIQGVPKNVRI